MKTIVLVFLLLSVFSGCVFAQSNELGFLAGTTFSPDFDHGTSYEGVFGHRVVDLHATSLYIELPVVGVTDREAPAGFIGGHFSSVFFTPSLKLKVLPDSALSPFLTAGAGFAHFNSTFTVRTGPFSVGDMSTSNTTWATQVGGGLDVKTPIPVLGLRLEVRDFLTGLPDTNLTSSVSHHNPFAGGGLVLRF